MEVLTTPGRTGRVQKLLFSALRNDSFPILIATPFDGDIDFLVDEIRLLDDVVATGPFRVLVRSRLARSGTTEILTSRFFLIFSHDTGVVRPGRWIETLTCFGCLVGPAGFLTNKGENLNSFSP